MGWSSFLVDPVTKGALDWMKGKPEPKKAVKKEPPATTIVRTPPSSSAGGKGGEGGNVQVSVTPPPPVPQKSINGDLLAALLSGSGGGGPPMSVEEFQNILGAAGITMPSAGEPVMPTFAPETPPIAYGQLPIDVRPIAALLDQTLKTKLYDRTPNLPEEYLSMAAKLRDYNEGGPIIRQAKAQAEYERYKSALGARSADQQARLIQAITGRRGLALGGEPGSTGGTAAAAPVTGGKAAAPGKVSEVSNKFSSLIRSKLPPTTAVSLVKAIADDSFDNQKALYDQQIMLSKLGGDLTKEAMNDKIVKNYSDEILPRLSVARYALKNDKLGGLGALTAIESFHKIIEPTAVFQSDIVNQQKMQSYWSQIEAFLNQLRNKTPLSENQKTAMFELMSEMQESYRLGAEQKIQEYAAMGAAQGVKPETITNPLKKKTERSFIEFERKDPKTGKWIPSKVPFKERADFRKHWESKGVEVREVGH